MRRNLDKVLERKPSGSMRWILGVIAALGLILIELWILGVRLT